jgi:hypothetical protein
MTTRGDDRVVVETASGVVVYPARVAVTALRPDGTLLAAHWRHPVPEYPRTGDDVHEALAHQPGLNRIAEHREADFLAEVYLHGPPVSVAQATGLA